MLGPHRSSCRSGGGFGTSSRAAACFSFSDTGGARSGVSFPFPGCRSPTNGTITVLRAVHASRELVQEQAHGEFVCISSLFAARRALPLRGLHRGHRRELAIRRFDAGYVEGDAAHAQLRLEGLPQQLQAMHHCELEVCFQRRILSRLMDTLHGTHCCQSLFRSVRSSPEMRNLVSASLVEKYVRFEAMLFYD